MNEQILSQVGNTYLEEIAQDYYNLVLEVGEHITVWERKIGKDRMNRDITEFVFGDHIRGIVVIRSIIMQYGNAGQTDVQQSFLMSITQLKQRDRIEYNGLLYEIERIIAMKSVFMHYLKELPNGS